MDTSNLWYQLVTARHGRFEQADPLYINSGSEIQTYEHEYSFVTISLIAPHGLFETKGMDTGDLFYSVSRYKIKRNGTSNLWSV